MSVGVSDLQITPRPEVCNIVRDTPVLCFACLFTPHQDVLFGERGVGDPHIIWRPKVCEVVRDTPRYHAVSHKD